MIVVSPIKAIDAYNRHSGNTQQNRDSAQNMQIPLKRFYSLDDKFEKILANELAKFQP